MIVYVCKHYSPWAPSRCHSLHICINGTQHIHTSVCEFLGFDPVNSRPAKHSTSQKFCQHVLKKVLSIDKAHLWHTLAHSCGTPCRVSGSACKLNNSPSAV